MSGPRSPLRYRYRLALLVAMLLAGLAGWAFYRWQVRAHSIHALSDSAREELAALPVPAVKAAAVEKTWLATPAGEMQYLMAPIGPMPCAEVSNLVTPADQVVVRDAWIASQEADQDVRLERLAAIHDTTANLVVVQLLGTALMDAGLIPEAERVLAQGLDATTQDEEIIRVARANAAIDLDDANVSTVIHIHHALGVARLNKSLEQPPWVSLKNVIGSVKPMSKRRLGGSTNDQPVSSRLLIAAPGCTRGAGQRTLSSYDLFNNLVVAYMRGNYAGYESEREKEFARPRKDRPDPLHRLLEGLVANARTTGWKNESKLWALSNVEQVIDWRVPDDARMAFNSVQVLDWWTTAGRCPESLCTAELRAGIEGVRNQLIEQALQRRNVSADQQAAFASGMLHMLASSTVPRSEVAASAEKLGEWLPVTERTSLEHLLAADTARANLTRFLFGKRHSDDPSVAAAEPPDARLGTRAERWRSAAVSDAVAVAASWGAARPPAEQRSLILALRQLLGSADAPPALVALEAQQPAAQRLLLRLQASRIFWAVVGVIVALLLWLLLLWLLVHLRERMLLGVSFYNVEMQHLAKIDRSSERR